MSDDENSKYPLDGGIEERLAALAKSKKLSTLTRIINETLRSWYPELSEKEMVICELTFSVMSSFSQGNSAMYIEIIAHLLEDENYRNENFRNEKEIENVIKSLVSKSVLEVREEEWIFGGDEKSIKVLAFTQENLYKELIEALNENFSTTIDAYFSPRRKYD
jgi:hypothetical protein